MQSAQIPFPWRFPYVPFPCVHRESEVRERLEPFYVGGKQRFHAPSYTLTTGHKYA